MTAVVKENDELDGVNIEQYVASSADPETAFKELGFEFDGVNRADPNDPCSIWRKHLGDNVWATVVSCKSEFPKVRYFKHQVKGPEWDVMGKELDRKMQVPIRDVRRMLMQWKNEDARAVVANLLDGSALDPYPNRCPHCGSTNVSESKELHDCYTCGLWFDPLEESGNPDDPEEYLKTLPQHPESTGMKRPNASATYWHYKFKSKEGHNCVLALSHSLPGAHGRYALSLDIGPFMRRQAQETLNLFWRTPEEFLKVEFAIREGVQAFISGVNQRKLTVDELKQHCNKVFDPLRQKLGPLAENLEDEISDLKAYAMQHGQPPRVTCTYSQTTPESVEAGDTSEAGWIDDEGVSMAPDEFDIEDGLTLADNTARFLQKNGATEASSSAFHPGVWYSTGYQTIDYKTGTDEERNYHLVGFTEEQEYEVWKKMFPENATR